MNIEIITVGDELLLGYTTDTNSGEIARRLAAIGIRVVHRTAIGDDVNEIAAALRASLDRTGAVITTGGLGPTEDDRTFEAVAEAFGRRMSIDAETLALLEERWMRRFGHAMPRSNLRQATVPEGAEVLRNHHGSAPGILMEDAEGRWVISLPGVPREVIGMVTDTVLPRLATKVARGAPVILSRTLRTVGVSESALADRLGELAHGVNGMALASLPGRDGVDLRVTSEGRDAAGAKEALDAAEEMLRARIGECVYGTDDSDLAAIVLEECRSRGLTLAVAESCTGGMLGMRITSLAGSSDTFLGGVISYANAVKEDLLGVDGSMLSEHGAVSEPVARAMASGVRKRLGADVGIGITGVAGPGGGTPAKPVGTVWVGVDFKGDAGAVSALLPGDRNEIRWRATQLALDSTRRMLAGDSALTGWISRG